MFLRRSVQPAVRPLCYGVYDYPTSKTSLMSFRIHGGSFIVGSATSPVLDGSKLALATNSIVAVVQHRLGAVSDFFG